jgi:formylglycine-generating enzyme required for sulfatase activity
MIEIPAGNFDLKIPILTSFSVDYVTKPISFNQPFLIGEYEVSNELWNLCYQDKGCNVEAKIEPGESLNHPAVRVNWHQAYQFTKWISQKTGRKYRLPTEEEWSYAAHHGKSHYETIAIYDYSSLSPLEQEKKITKPLGFYEKNDWGIADTNGNVWEWTLSCWFASEENILKERSTKELNSPSACFTRIAMGETRSHIPDFIYDTYNGGCASLRPAANLGFRLILDK